MYTETCSAKPLESLGGAGPLTGALRACVGQGLTSTVGQKPTLALVVQAGRIRRKAHIDAPGPGRQDSAETGFQTPLGPIAEGLEHSETPLRGGRFDANNASGTLIARPLPAVCTFPSRAQCQSSLTIKTQNADPVSS
jgi:hypothetical protein